MAREYAGRLLKTLFGLFLCAAGSLLGIQANIGLAPWDALSVGISKVSGLSYGTVSVWTGVVILAVDLLLREKIGLGTLLNTVLVGIMVDIMQSFKLVPLLDNFWLGVPMLLAGQTGILHRTMQTTMRLYDIYTVSGYAGFTPVAWVILGAMLAAALLMTALACLILHLQTGAASRRR